MPLGGSVRQLVLFDVADEIRLEELRSALGISPPDRTPAFSRPAPDYVRFERPPVIEPLKLQGADALLKYYDYGVISVEFGREFSLEWEELVRSSAGWLASAALEKLGAELLRERIARARSSLVNPYEKWLTEDYAIVAVLPNGDDAKSLLSSHGNEIAQIVRGKSKPLSESECTEILQAKLSYYPDDLLVVGWSAAFIYDTPAAAEVTVQLLEYANTQLLEFRHYDDLLTDVLAGVYKSLDRKPALWRRWGLAREAEHLNTIRLDITEIAERTETSIKFLSDMFYARMYRLAAARVGVPDYRRLVDTKLQAAGDLYELMVDRFERGRGFVLELLVVIILVIEIVFLFRGKG